MSTDKLNLDLDAVTDAQVKIGTFQLHGKKYDVYSPTFQVYYKLVKMIQGMNEEDKSLGAAVETVDELMTILRNVVPSMRDEEIDITPTQAQVLLGRVLEWSTAQNESELKEVESKKKAQST